MLRSSSCWPSPLFWRVASNRDAVDLWSPRRRASSATPASPCVSPRAIRSDAARSTDRTAFPSSILISPSGQSFRDAGTVDQFPATSVFLSFRARAGTTLSRPLRQLSRPTLLGWLGLPARVVVPLKTTLLSRALQRRANVYIVTRD